MLNSKKEPAIEILRLAIERAILKDRYRARPGNIGRPGQLIEELPALARESLKELTSEEARKERIIWF